LIPPVDTARLSRYDGCRFVLKFRVNPQEAFCHIVFHDEAVVKREVYEAKLFIGRIAAEHANMFGVPINANANYADVLCRVCRCQVHAVQMSPSNADHRGATPRRAALHYKGDAHVQSNARATEGAHRLGV
jgi:hypothetical protein